MAQLATESEAASLPTRAFSDFVDGLNENFERLKETGEAELITVDGEAKAVVLSPKAFNELIDEVHLHRESEEMRESLQQIKTGEYMLAEDYFAGLRAKLLAMQAEQEKAAAK